MRAVRAALGASRGRVVRYLLVESAQADFECAFGAYVVASGLAARASRRQVNSYCGAICQRRATAETTAPGA